MGFKLLEHTSEVGFRAEGENLEKAFEEAGRAVFQVMTDIDELETVEEVRIELESEDMESLLFDYVDRLLYLVDTENLLLKRFEVEIMETGGGYRLECLARGQFLEEGMRGQHVKAPTYSDMKVEEAGDGWLLQMYLDV